MDAIIIACKTIERELNAVMEQTGCGYPVIWLESGLHDVPKKLHETLQAHLDSIHGYDTVLLAMGFCGNSVAGLRTHDFELVIPRRDDCIGLLLGDAQRPFASMFLTEGWLRGGHHPGREYDLCMEKYGEKRGKRIFSALYQNYKNMLLLDTGCFDREKAETEIREIARKLNLEFGVVPGNLRELKRLVQGEWDEQSFVQVPPNSTVKGR